jgi:hypothetical protein
MKKRERETAPPSHFHLNGRRRHVERITQPPLLEVLHPTTFTVTVEGDRERERRERPYRYKETERTSPNHPGLNGRGSKRKRERESPSPNHPYRNCRRRHAESINQPPLP